LLSCCHCEAALIQSVCKKGYINKGDLTRPLTEVIWHFGCSVNFTIILRQFNDGMNAKVTLGGLESAHLFNIFILCFTKLLYKEIEEDSGVAVAYRLDGNLFNIPVFTIHDSPLTTVPHFTILAVIYLVIVAWMIFNTQDQASSTLQ